MVPRVKAAAAKENKSTKAKKKDGAATSSSAIGKPQKPVAKVAKCHPLPNKDATSQEGLSDQKSKTGNKRLRAEADPDQEVAQPSTKKQKKCSPAARKVCTRDKDGKTVPLPSAKTAKWKCISRESLDYLTTIIDGSIMTLLNKKVPDREAVQKHLSNLKGRLLAHCQHLKVPPEVSGQYKSMYTKLELEKEQLEFHQEALGELQDEVDKSVKALEQMAEEIEILQGKIHILKSQQDEDSLEVSSSPGNSISLDLPKASLEAPLLQTPSFYINGNITGDHETGSVCFLIASWDDPFVAVLIPLQRTMSPKLPCPKPMGDPAALLAPQPNVLPNLLISNGETSVAQALSLLHLEYSMALEQDSALLLSEPLTNVHDTALAHVYSQGLIAPRFIGHKLRPKHYMLLDSPADEVLKIPNQKALLQDLDTAMSLTAMQDMQALVEEAFAEVDAL